MVDFSHGIKSYLLVYQQPVSTYTHRTDGCTGQKQNLSQFSPSTQDDWPKIWQEHLLYQLLICISRQRRLFSCVPNHYHGGWNSKKVHHSTLEGRSGKPTCCDSPCSHYIVTAEYSAIPHEQGNHHGTWTIITMIHHDSSAYLEWYRLTLYHQGIHHWQLRYPKVCYKTLVWHRLEEIWR